MEQAVLVVNSLFDISLLAASQYYLLGYCTSIPYLKEILFVLNRYIKVNCSTLIVPIRVSIITTYLTYLIQTKVQLNFILSFILRIAGFLIQVLNPTLILLMNTLDSMLSYFGILIYAYQLVKISWQPGLYFQYNFNHALIVFIPCLIIFIYHFFQASTLTKILSVSLPILQIIITENGSLITSTILSLIIVQQDMILTMIIQLILVMNIIVVENNRYLIMAIGLILCSSSENTLFNRLAIIIIYIFTLIKSRTNKNDIDEQLDKQK